LHSSDRERNGHARRRLLVPIHAAC
jgi:hypothetical protein